MIEDYKLMEAEAICRCMAEDSKKLHKLFKGTKLEKSLKNMKDSVVQLHKELKEKVDAIDVDSYGRSGGY